MNMSLDHQFILVFGNPIDGITCYGPFETSHAAHTWVENSSAHKSDYWIAALRHPETL